MPYNKAWKRDLQESLDSLSWTFSDDEEDYESAVLKALVDRDWETIDFHIFHGYDVTRKDFYNISRERPSSERLEFLAERFPIEEKIQWMQQIRDVGHDVTDENYRRNIIIFAALMKATQKLDLDANKSFLKSGFRNLYMKAVERFDVRMMNVFFEQAGGLPLKDAFCDVKFLNLDTLKPEPVYPNVTHIAEVVKQLIDHGADPQLRIPREAVNQRNWVYNPVELWESCSWDIEMPENVCALEGASLLKFEILSKKGLIDLSDKEKEYYLFTQILAEKKLASVPGKTPCADFLNKIRNESDTSSSVWKHYWRDFLTLERLERTFFRMDDPISEVDHFASALISCGTTHANWIVSDRTLNWKAVISDATYQFVENKSKEISEDWFRNEDWLVRAHVFLEEDQGWGNQARSAILDCFQTHDCRADIVASIILDFCNLYSMNKQLYHDLCSPRNQILGSYCYKGKLDRLGPAQFGIAPVSRWMLYAGLDKDAYECLDYRKYFAEFKSVHIGFCNAKNLHQIFNSAEQNKERLKKRVANVKHNLELKGNYKFSERDLMNYGRQHLLLHFNECCSCVICQEGVYNWSYMTPRFNKFVSEQMARQKQ